MVRGPLSMEDGFAITTRDRSSWYFSIQLDTTFTLVLLPSIGLAKWSSRRIKMVPVYGRMADHYEVSDKREICLLTLHEMNRFSGDLMLDV